MTEQKQTQNQKAQAKAVQQVEPVTAFYPPQTREEGQEFAEQVGKQQQQLADARTQIAEAAAKQPSDQPTTFAAVNAEGKLPDGSDGRTAQTIS